MSHPALALHKAVYDKLRNTTAITTLVGAGIYDQVPPGAVYPYLDFAQAQIIEDGNTCDAGWEAFQDVHVWTQDRTDHAIKGLAYAKEIAGPVIDALGMILTISGFRMVSGKLENDRYLNDPREQVAHGVLTFRYLIDPA